MSGPASPEQIIHCLKSDMDGNLLAGARYAEKISRGFMHNPWAHPSDSVNYAEAARRLRVEHEEREAEDAHRRMFQD
jgi:hypothetical protein